MIRTIPMQHQKRVVDLASPLPAAAIVSPYGTGKSLVGLLLIQKENWKIVVVISTKTAIESTWPDEISKHSDFMYTILSGSSPQKARTLINSASRFYYQYRHIPQARMIVLVNYDGVKNIFPLLVQLKAQAVFLDEALRIKHGDTLRTQVMWAYGKTVPRRYTIGGFLFSDHFYEVYSQIKFLDNGERLGNSFDSFLSTYFEKKKAGPMKGKLAPKRGAVKKIYDKIKDICIIVPDNIINLPPAVHKDIALAPTDYQEELLEKVRKDMKIELERKHINLVSVFALDTKAREICDGFIYNGKRVKFFETPKDEALLDLVGQIGPSEKHLIWTTFRPTLYRIERLLTNDGHKVLTLHGDTPDVRKLVRTFQHSTSHNLLVAMIQKGNESVTLSNCRYATYYSHTWSNDQFGNSMARTRRKGSEIHESIIYSSLFIKNSVEERMRGNIHTKTEYIAKAKKYFC